MSFAKNIWLLVGLLLLIVFGSLFLALKLSGPGDNNAPEYGGIVKPGLRLEETDFEVLTEGLRVPWEIVFLPDGDLLVTLREGKLLHLSKQGKIQQQITLPDVVREETVSGGSLGIALHPEFINNNWVYLFETVRKNDAKVNRVIRYTFAGEQGLLDPVVILDDLPAAKYHNGGRLKFGPDNMLYVTTGDKDISINAQDVNSLAGKVLRIKDDGSIPDDNPFQNEVWSLGHRNAEDLVWDAAGKLWSTEHGNVSHDELNLIERGQNYGWPIIQGNETGAGLMAPVIESGPSWTWAPPAAAFVGEKLFFAGLKGESLFEVTLQDQEVTELKVHFWHDLGRIRVVRLGVDGYLYLATSNSDGQGGGKLRPGDDKIVRIKADVFE